MFQPVKLYVRKNDKMKLQLVELGADEEVPGDEFCYILGANGLHERISNDIYQGIVPSSNCPQLSQQDRKVRSRLPQISAETMEMIVGFFRQVWKKHRSEAIVLLYYSAREETYMILVPHQEVDAWEEDKYGWYRVDLKYETPNTPDGLLQRGYKLVGSVHSHGAYVAGHSHTDTKDEAHRNGLHITVGQVNYRDPQFSCSFMVQRTRKMLKTEDVIEGYDRPRKPRPHWIKRVKKGASRWGQRWGGAGKKDGADGKGNSNGNGCGYGYSNGGHGHGGSGNGGSGDGGNGYGYNNSGYGDNSGGAGYGAKARAAQRDEQEDLAATKKKEEKGLRLVKEEEEGVEEPQGQREEGGRETEPAN